MASLFTGLYPNVHGVQFYSYNQSFNPEKGGVAPSLHTKYLTLAEYFQSQGYLTVSIAANPWIRSEFGFGQGFEVSKQMDTWDGRQINTAFNTWIEEEFKKEPFFVYLHYMDVHAPYYNLDTFKELYTAYKGDHIYGMGFQDVLSEEDLSYSMALYDEEINYADGLIEEIFDTLKEKRILDNTLIVITSDHGEEFFEHQGMGHGTSLYAEQLDTFFVLFGPSLLKPRKIEQKVKVIDFFPTILDVFGMEYDFEQIEGESLYPLIKGKKRKNPQTKIFSELGDKKTVLFDDWKYIYNPVLKTEELYDLKKDPNEGSNLADDKEKQRKKLSEFLSNFMQKGAALSTRSIKISKDLMERLKALGYLSSGSIEQEDNSGSLKKPISDRIDVKRENYNPLQLVFGWKKKEEIDEEIFYWVGSLAKFVLKRSLQEQIWLRVEGRVDLRFIREKTQKLTLYCENYKVGEVVLDREGPFSLDFKIPPSLGQNRSLKFTIICQNFFEALNLSLLISSIYLY